MFGDRLKEARLALGYSAEQVAEFLGVSPATVYRYEKGDISKFPGHLIKPLAKFLCVSPAYLMEWDDQTNPSDESQSPNSRAPKTIEAKIVSFGMDQLPKEQRETILRMLQTMYQNNPDLFKERN